MDARIEDNTVVIEIPLEKPRLSSTGKTLLIASSRGVQRSTARLKGKTISFVANAFIETDGTPAKQRKPTTTQKKRREVEDDELEED